MENVNAVAEETVTRAPVAALADAEDSTPTPSAELSNNAAAEMYDAEEVEAAEDTDEEDNDEQDEDND